MSIERPRRPRDAPQVVESASNRRLQALSAQLQEAPSEELVNTACREVAQMEELSPDSESWDRYRYALALQLHENNHINHALRVVHDIGSPASAATAIIEMAQHASEDDLTTIMEAFGHQFHEEEDMQRYQYIVRLTTDCLIDINPENNYIDGLEAILARHNPQFDPVESWVMSQSIMRPDIAASEFIDTLRDNDLWSDIPLRRRQHYTLEFIKAQELVRSDPYTELVERTARTFREREAAHPNSVAWEYFRGALSYVLLEDGYPLESAFFACETHSPALQQGLAIAMVEAGFNHAAAAVVRRIDDPKILVNTLLEWPREEEGWRLLEDILHDTSRTKKFRRECQRH